VLGWKLNSCLSLWRSFLCEIVSYAFVRSSIIAIVGFFLLIFLVISSMIDVSAMVVSELGRKAYWCGDIRLCVVRCSMSCLFISVSKIFPIMGSRDMGRKFAGR